MGNEDLTNCIPWYCPPHFKKMVRRKEECVERINLEKERVDYDWKQKNRRSCKA